METCVIARLARRVRRLGARGSGLERQSEAEMRHSFLKLKYKLNEEESE